MNEQQQAAILTLSLMAAFADGGKDESERTEIKRIADALAGEGTRSPSVPTTTGRARPWSTTRPP